MSPKCLFWASTFAAVLWCEIFAYLLDNAALCVLGFFAALVWVWGANVGTHYFQADDNQVAPAARERPRARTTRR